MERKQETLTGDTPADFELLLLLKAITVPLIEHFSARSSDENGCQNQQLSRKTLIASLWELNLFLAEYCNQVQTSSTQLSTASRQTAKSIESTLHGSRIVQVINSAHLEALVTKGKGLTGFPKLENFRNLVLEIPRSQQIKSKDRPILKGLTEYGYQILSTQVSSLTHILWQRNPQSESSPALINQKVRRMRYSAAHFHNEWERRHRSDELYKLLCRYWPCSCGQSHEKKLGSCGNIMLCLRPRYIHDSWLTEEYDLLLQYGILPLYCTVSFQDIRLERRGSTQPQITTRPCQFLFDGARGMRLKIVASEVDSSDLTAQFYLDSISVTEPDNFATLQSLLEKGVILQVRERRILAIILLYSFMQLLDGPWLQQHWDGSDISFFQFNAEGTRFFNFRQPYLSACWMTTRDIPRPNKLQGYHPMPDMVTLARFLLELELQDTRFSPNLAQDLPSDLLKALRLLEKLKVLDRDLQGRGLFIESMTACLDTQTYTKHPKDSPHLLLWEIYQNIVDPLEQNLLSMLGPKATVQDLEKELASASPKVNATLETDPARNPIDLAPQINTASDHWFDRLENETHQLMKTVRGGAVSIAILDTGIDLSHPMLVGKIAEGDCWDFVSESANVGDEVGHGTHTTSLLLKTAPRARIFCARVWRTRKEENSTGELVAKAILHAVDTWNVNIIAMPFAFPEDNNQVADAIDHAHSRNVLLFAAASNKSDLKLGFPACLPEVTCIYSNKSASVSSSFCRLGREKECNFSVIGEDVEGAWPLQLNNGKPIRRESGTSCSTPIVAGVAALILEYATQKYRYPVKLARELRKKGYMEKVMLSCMTDGSTVGVYNMIEPWKLLSTHDGTEPRSLLSITNAIEDQIKARRSG